jgi:hypothetical protein
MLRLLQDGDVQVGGSAAPISARLVPHGILPSGDASAMRACAPGPGFAKGRSQPGGRLSCPESGVKDEKDIWYDGDRPARD